MSNKKIKFKDEPKNIIPCINCNPKKYLTFNFSYITYEKPSEPHGEDIINLWKRMRWMSNDQYLNMIHNYGTQKDKWFENIPINNINKEIPLEFRKDFPTETNEKFSVMRVYPSGRPKGAANPRIIGMLKHNIFYVFYLDWEGKLYSHG